MSDYITYWKCSKCHGTGRVFDNSCRKCGATGNALVDGVAREYADMIAERDAELICKAADEMGGSQD